MTRTEAYKLDTEFEADLDEGTGYFCVFGNNSSFAYASFADEGEAKQWAKRMNDERAVSTGIEPVSG